MRTLVTGITGFVGGHLTEHLLAEGDSVTGCSRRGAWPKQLAHLVHRTRLIRCDLCDSDQAQSLLEHETFDSIFHLAGLASPQACLADPETARRENVVATENLYEAIRRSGQQPRVLFISTCYVYGQPAPSNLPVTITCPIRAEHPYAATKWAAEQISLRFAEMAKLDIIRIRPFNHTGPRQPAGYMVSDWAGQIAAIEAGKMPARLHVGNLDTRRDYSDVRDIVRAYRMIAGQPQSRGVYNVGSGVSRSGREILELLRGLSRVPWEVVEDRTRMRTSEIQEIVADTTAIRSFIGWKPEVDFKTTLADTLEYWRGLQGGNL